MPDASSSTAPAAASAAPASTAAPDAAAAAAAASASATPAGKPAATALNVDPAAAAAAASAPAADWRAAFGADDKLTKALGRFATPEAFGKAYLEAQAKIGQGLKAPLKEGASEQEIAAWRTENGIPEKPDGYFEKLPQGLVIGEDDKALFTEWGAAMHKLNAPPALVAETVRWYYQMQEQQVANQQAMDRQHQTEATTALKQAFGRDYTENINLVKSFMGGLAEDTQAMFMDATLPDGRRLFNSPEIVQWLANKAREVNPLAFIPGPGAGDEGKSLDDRIAAIEATMGTPAYLKNEPKQAELRALYERRTQLQSRAGAA